jgi:sulfatase maturation enzyme AslB (radical SAM superfamily)
LPTIKQFDFYGGEPFLSKKMWHLLERADDLGYAKDIELHYNTNGTTWPEAQIKAWSRFKQVNLSFSIDGTDEQFEYMRYPAKWNIVKTNIDKAREFRDTYSNMQLSWCITLSTLNIFNLPEILDEYYKSYSDIGIYLNLVHGPTHYNINILPEDYKSIIIKRLEAIPKEYESAWHQLPGIINFMKAGKPDNQAWDLLFKTTVLHDAYRDQKFNHVFPAYSNIIKYKDNT